MTNTEFIVNLIARRDALTAQHASLVASGETFSAEDLWPDVEFAIRAAHDALMGR